MKMAACCHDLKNYLTAAVGNLDLGDTEAAEMALNMAISLAVRTQTELMNELREYSHPT
jgi:hypothetical protein